MPKLNFLDKQRFIQLEQKLLASKSKITLIPAYIFILLAIGAVILPATVVMAPAVAAGLGVGGFAFLSVIGYGLINDMLACRDSLEYFRFGHQPGQRDRVCIPSTNKDAQAFYWGILATWVLGLIGAVVIGICAGIAAVPLNSIILPVISAAILTSLAITHFGSKRLVEKYTPSMLWRATMYNDEIVAPLNDFKAQRNWLRSGIRNSIGYNILPLFAVSLSVALIIQAAAGIALFAALPVAAPIIPLVLSIPLVLFIGGMAINYLRHKNTVVQKETLLGKFDIDQNKNESENDNDGADNSLKAKPTPQQSLVNAQSILTQKSISDSNSPSLKECSVDTDADKTPSPSFKRGFSNRMRGIFN